MSLETKLIVGYIYDEAKGAYYLKVNSDLFPQVKKSLQLGARQIGFAQIVEFEEHERAQPGVRRSFDEEDM